MFTGLVETTGALAARTPNVGGFRLAIESDLGELEIGESVSVSGACLTVTASDKVRFSADITRETVDRTTLGRLVPGVPVNLERSLRAGDRMGGHVVTGHVDGVARVVTATRDGESLKVRLEAPPELMRFIATKGSVALDGVSLTVNAVHGVEFEIMLIPHTLAVTTLGHLRADARLNLEIDLMARYAARYLEATLGSAASDVATPSASGRPLAELIAEMSRP
jgi:riboflavin synthase